MFANLAPAQPTSTGELYGATALLILLTMAAWLCHLCSPSVTIPVPVWRAEDTSAVWAEHYAATHSSAPTQCRSCYRSDHSRELGHYAESGAPCACACALRPVSA